MKTFGTFLTVLLIVTSTASFAFIEGENSALDDPMTERILPGQKNGVFNLIYAQKQEQSVRVKIYNSSRSLIHEDRIKSEGGFKRPYDLSDLTPGVYFFEIQDGDSKITHQVLYSQKEPKIGLRKIGDDRIHLTVSDSQDEKLTVQIFDGYDKLIYSDEIVNKGGFSKIYNLSKVGADNVTLQVKHNSKILGTIGY